MARFEELDRLKIPLEDIILATNNFAEDNFIGMGGFGRVYKGQLLRSNSSCEPISTTIAVKRLAEGDMTGQGVREFRKEIIMLARYKHTNLVSFVGFSDESGEKIIAYKYEVNGSLDRHLASKDLTCDQRLQICLGAARGLEYLHDSVGIGHRVLHRDIKSANILLDENWEAKISDLGLSTIGPTNIDFSFLASHTCGTLGYVDPQYFKTGVLSKESDVYSLGVVIFEVLCGRLAVRSQYHDERRLLSNLVRCYYEQGKIEEIIMTDVREQMNPYSLQMISRIAYECLNERQDQRPSTRRLVQELKSSLEFKNGSSSPTTLYGSSTGGSPWSYLLDNNLKLRKLKIDHKDWIFSIAFTIEDLSSTAGSFISCCEGGAGGPSDGQVSEISFDADEEIIHISGTVGVIIGNHPDVVIISSLCIVTNKRRHGPFGKETGTSFSVPFDAGSFAGFYGRSGFYMDGLGFYSRRS